MVKSLISAAFFVVSVASIGQSPPNIRVFVDAKEVIFEDQGAIERKGTVYVPLKGVFQRIGANIRFDEAAKIVYVTYGEKQIEVPIGIDHSYQNGNVTLNGGKAIIVSGRTMVPLRFLAEQIDAKVHWEGATRSVKISTVKALEPASGGTSGGGTGGR